MNGRGAKIVQLEVARQLVDQAQRQCIAGAAKRAIVDMERQQHKVSVVAIHVQAGVAVDDVEAKLVN